MNNQVCPACQSPMTTAPTNLTLDFQSNLHSIQNRRRGSSPNLFLNLNKKRLSGKKFSQNYKTENEEFSEMMNPGDANVFKRGWSRVDDQKRTSFNSSPHGEKKKILDNKNLRKMYESHQNKFPDNQVSPEEKNIIFEYDSLEKKKAMKRSKRSNRQRIADESDENETAADFVFKKKITLKNSNQSSGQLYLDSAVNLEEVLNEFGETNEKVQEEDIYGETKKFIKVAKRVSHKNNEGQTNKNNKYSAKTISNSYNAKEMHFKQNVKNQHQKEEIDNKVVSKFRKLKDKRKKKDDESRFESSKNNSKKLIPIGSNEYYNDLKKKENEEDIQAKIFGKKLYSLGSPIISGKVIL